MKPLKILMIGWEYPPAITGGLGIACRGLAREVAARGHTVYFVLPRVHGNEPRDPGVNLIGLNTRDLPISDDELKGMLLNFAEQHGDEILRMIPFGAYESPVMTAEQISQNLDLIRKQLSQEMETNQSAAERLLSGGYGSDLIHQIHLYADFCSLIGKRLNVDLIHGHDWMTFPASLGAMVQSGKPLVAHVHATEFDRSGIHGNRYVEDLERHTFNRASAVVTVSNYTRNIIINRYGVSPDKVFAVHNAVELEEESVPARRPFEDKMITFLGRITFQKGPDYFVRAARKVIDQNRNVRFVMVGTGDMYPRMIELAADLGIGKYFHYTGFLKRDQIKQIYGMSDLYVIPSVSEPFGLTALEAMAQGVPVIVSRQSGVSEVIEHAIKLDFWDVDAIAKSILDVIGDDALHTQLKHGGLKEVRKISWANSAQKLEEVYGRVIP
ncbi:MAG: glycosyltransferase family 4 protein [Leptospiraceae bacterium]